MFIPDIFGGNPPEKKTYKSPPTAAKLCSKSFFGRDNELQIHNGNILLIDNKHGKLFVIKQSKECRFMNKMRQNLLGDWVPPRPAEGAYALPQTSSCNEGLLIRGRREGRGPLVMEREGRRDGTES